NIPVLTIGAPYSVTSYSNIEKLIEQINDEFGDYRIEIKDYGEYSTEENPEGNLDAINQDFIAGTAPDIFVLDDYTPIENMGAFEDLYNFIDNDPELNRDAFIPKILEYAENDGKLYSLPLEFAISTNVGKTKYVGEKENWTYAEYIDTVTRLKDTVPYLSEDMMNPNIITRASPLYQFDYFKSFFDFESGTCNFDNPEFIDILEYCYNFSDNADPPEFVYEEPSIEEMNAEFEMRNMSYRNDQALLHNCYFSSFQSYLEITAGYFDNEEITFVGYPSNDGTGTQIRFYESLRINAASKNKELAWKFIKRLMDYTYTENNITFGITKESLKNAAELAKQPLVRDNTDYTGEYFHTGNKLLEIGNVTDKEIEGVYHLLDIAKKEKIIPYDYIEIIYEEADKYFHDECTAKQAAEMIQNRLTIFIAEQQ
ncbi:MAG: extracellular solute-binding protein, partial [Ruminococcus sp.]|nr:extracellular solute-binding protein [Ruminococcus sp.]